MVRLGGAAAKAACAVRERYDAKKGVAATHCLSKKRLAATSIEKDPNYKSDS